MSTPSAIHRQLRTQLRYRRPAIAAIGFIAAIGSLTAISATGCGSESNQSTSEKAGTWKVEVDRFSFPTRQHLAENSELVLSIKNADTSTIPNLAVTVDGFYYRDKQPDLADPKRPAWVLNRAPSGSETAFTNTYTFGEVGAGQTATLRWKVTAVRVGSFTVKYKVAAGLSEKTRATLSDGSPARGSIRATIVPEPRRSEVKL